MTYLDRMKGERIALDEKLHKLRDFLDSPAVEKLNKEEYADLRYQCFLMTQYVEVLNRRIERGIK